jgi:excinuclease ABC subunit B
MSFQLHAPYTPKGDQPSAIETLTCGVEQGQRYQTLLGATGTGKTFSIANVIARTGRPTLVLAHNKTLAAQLCNELREFFPHNAVEYFISYYDYYQPEAYVPVSDTYIAKTASINEEIDMLRHSATRSLFERRDVIVVASISCIYGLGIPSEYLKAAVKFEVGKSLNLRSSLRELVNNQYSRNDIEVGRGRFRVRGDVVEIGPAYEDRLVRIELFGDEVEAIRYVDPTTGEILQSMESVAIYPAKHFVTPKDRLESAIAAIRAELHERLEVLNSQGRLLEAQRLEQRTTYDLEMLTQVGYCNGVENYARHLAGREAGTPPECLIDYFPKDWLLVVDESHVTCSQLQAMYNGDQSRKQVLIEHGFRLPSAPTTAPSKVMSSGRKPTRRFSFPPPLGHGNWAEPGPGGGAGDPSHRACSIRLWRCGPPKARWMICWGKSVCGRRKRSGCWSPPSPSAWPRTSPITWRRTAIRVRYLHSEIHSIERIEIIQDLRNGEYDVLVGVNLLREGLDLPEVSLVAILDADKEGFLRAERSLIQTIGRAARHIDGKALLYADNLTDSMAKAISETERRRRIQQTYNEQHGITPTPAGKRAGNAILAFLEVSRRLNDEQLDAAAEQAEHNEVPLESMPELITQLEDRMKKAAKNLEFEEAANLRDRIKNLRQKLVGKA